jgi:DNA polymerase III subunit gamma/tau
MAGDIPSAAAADPARRGDHAAPPMALYRRYRPATFAELKGQDHVTEPLRQALRSGRVHHAYLFSGPRGCGKTSSARILARSLNCEQGPTPDPCGKCDSCVALAPSGPGSIDVIEIDAASHGGVDDARDLRERAFYAPVSGRFKIYIVDEAHMVTREGFNALLKLVEEPPPHLKFVFATTEPEKVIATIRSRTHHYPFRLMPPAVLRGLLEEILASEGVRYEPAVLPVVVRAGAGSARDALSVLDQLLAGSDEAGLTYERAVALLGYTDENLLDEVTEAFATGDGAAVFQTVDRVVEAGHDPRRFATDLLDRFRDLIVLAAVPDAAETGLLDVPGDRLDRMREQASGFGQAQLARAAAVINDGLVEMRGATSPRLQLELMCAQVLLPPAAAGDGDLLARLERLERRLGPGGGTGQSGGTGQKGSAPERRESGAPTPDQQRPDQRRSDQQRPDQQRPDQRRPDQQRSDQPRPAAAPEPAEARAAQDRAASPAPRTAAGRSAPPAGPPDADLVRERWPEILEAVKHQSKVAWVQVNSASVDTLQDGILTLRFSREGEAKVFSAGRSEVLGQVLERMLGITPRIRAVAGGGQDDGGGSGPAGREVGGGSGPAGREVGGGSGGRDAAGGAADGVGETAHGAGGTAHGADATAHGAGGTVHGADATAHGAGGTVHGPGAGDRRGENAREGDAETGGAAPGTGRVQERSGAQRVARETAERAAARGPRRVRAGGASGGGASGGAGPAGQSYADEADDDPGATSLTGMDLIQHTLGGQVIGEIGED